MGGYIWESTIGVINGDTRSLDYSSCYYCCPPVPEWERDPMAQLMWKQVGMTMQGVLKKLP